MPKQPIHEALSRIQKLVKKKGSPILYSSEILRKDRELLVKNRWLQEIIRGWFLVIRPDLPVGDSTAWYASFWDFLKVYLEYHYGKEYCLSAECSLDLHVGSSIIPKQIIVTTKKGSGTPVKLPFDTSLLVYSDTSRLQEEHETLRGLCVMPLARALCKVSPIYFKNCPRDAEIALRSIANSSDLLRVLSEHQFKSAAGRLVGAYRFIKMEKMAEEIKNGLLDIGIPIVEKNPFNQESPLLRDESNSPYSLRIHAMWKYYRQDVIAHFPKAPGLPKNKKAYLDAVKELYTQDAYNSLSIEGYQVTQELIEKVKNAKWNPDIHQKDLHERDVLAARGYYEAFQDVRKSMEKILNGKHPGTIVKEDLSRWYQKLFAPFVQVGTLSAKDLFGYRKHQVYIRKSRHTPPEKEYISDAMEAFFQCLQKEENAAVRAVLGHFIFVYIHPYMDGNGRIARFLMNTMLASQGYPWTIIHVETRNKYFEALEKASVEENIIPFTQFVASELERSGYQ